MLNVQRFDLRTSGGVFAGFQDMVDDESYQFGHIDELDLAVNFDAGCFVVGKLVAEGGDDRVIVRMAEGAEYVGDDESGEF